MKYYVIEIASGDAKIAGKSIYEYASLNEALAAYHTKMGTAMKSSLYTADLIMVINSSGGVHVTDNYVAAGEE